MRCRMLLVLLVALWALGLVGWAAGVTVSHLGHSCFRLQAGDGSVILLDDEGRCREKVPPASWAITPAFKTHAIEGNHVTESGGGQGWVCMFGFELGGLQFAHLGDLGRTLSEAQIAVLEDVDVWGLGHKPS